MNTPDPRRAELAERLEKLIEGKVVSNHNYSAPGSVEWLYQLPASLLGDLLAYLRSPASPPTKPECMTQSEFDEAVGSAAHEASPPEPPASPPPAPASPEWAVKLQADIRSIKDSANEMGAGDPPAGYDDLANTEVADACYHQGIECMATAVLNWAYDQQRELAELRRPTTSGETPATYGGAMALVGRLQRELAAANARWLSTAALADTELARVTAERRDAKEKLMEVCADRIRLRTALAAAQADAKRVESLPHLKAQLVWHFEGDEDERTIWWQVVRRRESISGHPLGSWQEAIDAATPPGAKE